MLKMMTAATLAAAMLGVLSVSPAEAKKRHRVKPTAVVAECLTNEGGRSDGFCSRGHQAAISRVTRGRSVRTAARERREVRSEQSTRVLIAGRNVSRETSSRAVTYLPHPPCCPARAFCACGASFKIFGKCVRALWPSSVWAGMPAASPGHLKVAVRRGHVFVIDYMIDARTAMAWDYNSGGHRSRYHPRRIDGYRIVDARASRYARG